MQLRTSEEERNDSTSASVYRDTYNNIDEGLFAGLWLTQNQLCQQKAHSGMLFSLCVQFKGHTVVPCLNTVARFPVLAGSRNALSLAFRQPNLAHESVAGWLWIIPSSPVYCVPHTPTGGRKITQPYDKFASMTSCSSFKALRALQHIRFWFFFNLETQPYLLSLLPHSLPFLQSVSCLWMPSFESRKELIFSIVLI